MKEWTASVFRAVIDAAPEGIVVCSVADKDHPVVYANAAFERLTGYGARELIGEDLRRLQGCDDPGQRRTEQEGQLGLDARMDVAFQVDAAPLLHQHAIGQPAPDLVLHAHLEHLGPAGEP